MNRFSKDFAKLLYRAGWSIDRSISVDHWVAELSTEGFQPHAAAVSVLQSIGGLNVKLPSIPGVAPYEGELQFDPVRAATGEHDRAAHWESDIGAKLFPIGEETTSGNVVWLADDERVYYGRGFGLYRIGDTFSEAMDNLAFVKTQPVKCAE